MEITGYFERNVLENPERSGVTREMCEAVAAAAEFPSGSRTGATVIGAARRVRRRTCG